MYTYMCAYVCTYMYIYNVYTPKYIYIHTFIYTHSPTWRSSTNEPMITYFPLQLSLSIHGELVLGPSLWRPKSTDAQVPCIKKYSTVGLLYLQVLKGVANPTGVCFLKRIVSSVNIALNLKHPVINFKLSGL